MLYVLIWLQVTLAFNAIHLRENIFIKNIDTSVVIVAPRIVNKCRNFAPVWGIITVNTILH